MPQRNNKFYENASYTMTANFKFNTMDFMQFYNVADTPSSIEEFVIGLVSYITVDGDQVIMNNYHKVTNLIFNHDMDCHHYSVHNLDEVFTTTKNVRVHYDSHERKTYIIKVQDKEYELEITFTKTTLMVTIAADINLKTVAEHFTI